MFAVYKDDTFTSIGRAPRPKICPVFDSDNKYFLAEIYTLCFLLLGKRIKLVIPESFIFDGASIPRFFWRIVGHPYKPRFVVAAIPHDALFGAIDERIQIWIDGRLVSSEEASEFFTREVTDLLFKYLLQFEKNTGFKVRIMHKAVRAGGWLKFRKSKNQFHS